MIKTDLSGFVVTMHSGLCEQYAKSLRLRRRGTWSKRSRDKTPPSQNVTDSDKTYPGVGQNVPAC